MSKSTFDILECSQSTEVLAGINDFFTKRLHGNLPEAWRNNKMTIEELGHYLALDQPFESPTVWPLSLLALRKTLENFSLQRKRDSLCYSSPHFPRTTEGKVTACFRHPRLTNLFLKHVKPKKRYEIEKMASETAALAASTGVKTVVDIGSGLGHLCRTLAYGYGLDVVGVELQEELSRRAQLLDQQLEVTASKHLSADELDEILRHQPSHVLRRIDFETSQGEIMEIIRDGVGSERDFGIVGLHPCGDLAAILLRLFVSCRHAKFINIIGCCYHKMTLSGTHKGFPLSRHLSQHKDIMSVESANLGCHAIEAYSDRLIRGDYDHLKVHCFRACLERIIVRRWPHHARAGLNNVKHYPQLSFPEYCEKALKKLGLEVPEEDFSREDTKEDLARWKDAVVYHSLWLMLGPATESVVLLDRLLFLLDNDVPCRLQAAFDPKISSRNHILVGVKPS